MCFLSLMATNDSTSRATLSSRGQSVLSRLRCWREHSSWNWENKVLLLEAMEMQTLGNYDAARLSYTRSIQSAHEHKFVHEEAIASELAGDFFCEQGHQLEAYALYMHSIKCFNEWGALAVAKRVESSVESKFGSDTASQLGRAVNVDGMIQLILLVEEDSADTKKRPSELL